MTKADPDVVTGFDSDSDSDLTQDRTAGAPVSEDLSDPRLEAIRHIVLGREQDILTRIQHRIENRGQFTDAVSGVLTDAVNHAAACDEQLGRALLSAVGKIARDSTKRDAGLLVNILSPLMFPAFRKATKESLSNKFFYLASLALLIVGAYYFFQHYRQNREFEQYLQRLQAEPGIVVANAGKQDGVWHINGLKDPLATNPADLLKGTTLLTSELDQHWEPFLALHPAIVLKRLQASLDPISTVEYSLQGNTILIHGSASHHWIQKAHMFSSALPRGFPVLDLSAVKDTDIKDFEKLRDAIQSRLIYFDHNIPKPAAGQEAVVESLAADLKELWELANRFHLAVQVTLTGHADSTGKDTPNFALSMERAEVVLSLLKAKGVDPGLLTIRGAGPSEPLQTEASEKDRSRNRRVSFTVKLIE